MTEILSRGGAVPAAGLTLLRLDDLPGLDDATIETLRDLARPQAGLALLVLAGSGDEQRGLPVPLPPRSAGRANPARLTPRELEILHLLTDGLTNRQIAAQLYLSERTVAHHVSAVLRKLGQPNRSAAVATAVRRGIVRLPQPVR